MLRVCQSMPAVKGYQRQDEKNITLLLFSIAVFTLGSTSFLICQLINKYIVIIVSQKILFEIYTGRDIF